MANIKTKNRRRKLRQQQKHTNQILDLILGEKNNRKLTLRRTLSKQESTHERGAQNTGTYKRRRHNNDFSHAKSFMVHIPSNQEAFHIEAPPYNLKTSSKPNLSSAIQMFTNSLTKKEVNRYISSPQKKTFQYSKMQSTPSILLPVFFKLC
jgi:hypothetical protein